MVDVGLGEICGFRPGEPKLCSVAERDMLTLLPLTGVRAIVSAYTLRHGHFNPRFRSPYSLAGTVIAPGPDWVEHILRELP